MVTVSTSAFYGRAAQQLSALRSRAETLQGQIGTGQRLARSSDDPAAAAQLRNLGRQQKLAQMDARNASRAQADLRLADQSTASMADIVIRARELAVQARSTTLSSTNFAQIRVEVLNLREGLLGLANARDGAGNALFGGEVPGDAYSQTAGIISYAGAATAPDADLGDGQSVPRSMVGPDMLSFDNGSGGTTDMFAVLADFAAALDSGGAAASAGAGDALDLLETGLEKLTSAQTVIGTRQAWVESVGERRTLRSEIVAEEQDQIGGADLAGTISRLKELMTVLEASQASFVRLSQLTLFDRLN